MKEPLLIHETVVPNKQSKCQNGKFSFEQSVPEAEMDALLPPSIENKDSPCAQLIEKHQMSRQERLALILALFRI